MVKLLRRPEIWILAAGFGALILILLPGAFPGLPPLLRFLATLVLFMIPGAVASLVAFGRSSFGFTHVPVAFALSTGLFGLAGVPLLVLHRRLAEYLLVCGAILSLSVLFALLKAVRGAASSVEAADGGDRAARARLLWAPLALLTAALAVVSTRTFHAPGTDTWTYSMYVQDYLVKGVLTQYDAATDIATSGGGISRLSIDGWLLEQAAVARLSGLDVVSLVLDYLAPTLVVVSLLAFYALARVVLESSSAGFLAATLYALFFLLHLDSSLTSPGGEFVGRITEDKFAARFVFLPVALVFAALFIKERRLKFLAFFAFVCCAVVTVHPLILVNVAVAVGGFGAVHLALTFKEGKAWLRVGGLAAVLLGIVVPPAVYLLLRGSALPSLLDATDPASAERLTRAAEKQQRLMVLGDGSYIMHPSLLLTPVVLGACLVGIPFLVWRVKKNLGAQLLLGTLVLSLVVLYVPSVATFVGDMTGPWHLWRLSWPLSLVAPIVLGWVIWDLVLRIRAFLLSKVGGSEHAAPYLPLALVGVILAVSAQPAILGFRAADRTGGIPINQSSCTDPVFEWMREHIGDPGVMLTRGIDSVCVPAQLASAKLVAYRAQGDAGDQPSSQQDLQENQPSQNTTETGRFFKAGAVDEKMIDLLLRYGTDHILLPAASSLNTQLAHLPGFTPLGNSGERYRLYRVNRQELAVTPLIEANGYFNEGKWAKAAGSYTGVIQTGNQDERFSALLGIGQTYTKRKLFKNAVQAYEAAAELEPKDSVPYELIAEANVAAGDAASATEAVAKAVELSPGDTNLRLDLGKLLLEAGDERKAVKQYEAVAKAYPRVPTYRVQLGEALGSAGDKEAAAWELERAVSLDPLSAKLHKSVAKAYQRMGEPEEAKAHRQRAAKL